MPMNKLQDEIFSSGESDAWFRRNRAVLEDAAKADPVLDVLRQHVLAHQPASVLDVGCSNGWRLAQLEALLPAGARLACFDASAEAIESAKQRHPNFDAKCALVSAIPFAGSFDLVIVACMLCWVGRESLMQSIAEIDRCVAPGGDLVVADFDPDEPARRRYHHRADVEMFTYKQDYAQLFLDAGRYTQLSRSVFQPGGVLTPLDQRAAIPSDERFSVSVLRKLRA